MSELKRTFYDDNTQDVLHLFQTAEMTEYFQLAFKYGEQRNIPRECNRYIIAALKCLEMTVGSINSYCHDYSLKPRKSLTTRLFFITSCEYYMPYETITELYNFFDFFSERLPILKRDIMRIQKQAEKRKPKKIERRKAA